MRRPRRLAATLALPLAGLVAQGTWMPSEAKACGGTFCDVGPQAMPVDQTGENILFVMEGNTVEAHIQIQYDPDTDAEQFAWVIPVVALPEFSVGTENLFTNLLAGSVPSYGVNRSSEACGRGGANEGAFGDTAGGEGGDDGGDGDGAGPDVVFQETVGAYEIAVLDGGTIEGVMEWLALNGYQQDPAAEPILAEYLAEGQLFVALKLATGTGVDSIHPIVIKYEGDEPCVPIRLTRIAAAENMEIRTFFLGEHRTVPSNYRHVLINDAMVDWINLGTNYRDLVTQAVDADSADGQAFVTEYAGPSDVVPRFGLWSQSWDAGPFAAMADPITVVDTLEAQDLMFCGGASCDFQHPLVEPLLAEFVPVPSGVDSGAFYDCLSCYAAMIDADAWNGPEFGAALAERIILPGRHALDLLEARPYLTRLYTTISPGEMTVDPMFFENPDLQEVPAQRIAQAELDCGGGTWWTLPSGRRIYLPADQQSWPSWPGEMPWDEEVQQGTMAGPNQTLVDNSATIQAVIDTWNLEARRDLGAAGCACDVHADRGAQRLGLAGLLLLGAGAWGARRRRRASRGA